MDGDPLEIPVQPIPFAQGLINFNRAIIAKFAKVVAIGSSTTAGEGKIAAYPGRLLSFLQGQYPEANIAMFNRGIGGQDAPVEFRRFKTDVIPEQPDLVIWQVGTNAIWQPADQHPPSFEETTEAIRDGLAELKSETRADIVLMDLQYVPAVLTPAKRPKAEAMVKAIGKLANDAGVNVFRRFAFMEALHEIEGISFDRLVDPTDGDRLHAGDWATDRVAWALKLAIVGGVDKARAAEAAKPS